MKEPQVTKQRIDTGEAGNASTGDSLYDGGVKINSNFYEIYNAFGDWRLSDNEDEGAGLQKIHATGYYQKYPITYYTSGPIELGTKHDIDTTDNPLTITLPNGKQGEMVEFRDSKGTWGTNSVFITPQAGEGINGDSQTVELKNPNSVVLFTCTDDTVGSVNWTYKIVPLGGDYSVPVNQTIEVTNVTDQTFPLFDADMYNGVKLMVYASDLNGNNKSISEVLMMVDADGIITDEYSIINKGQTPYTVTWFISGDSVLATVSTTLTRITFTVKVIETIKVES